MLTLKLKLILFIDRGSLAMQCHAMAKAAYAAGSALSRGPALSDCAMFCSALPF